MKKEISDVIDLLRSNNFDKALQIANSLYKKDQNNIGLNKLLAYIYMQKNAYPIAVQLLKRGFTIKPDLQDFDYFNNLGYSLLRMEEYEEALEFLNKALEMEQENPGVYTNFAEIHLALRNFNKANDYIDMSIDRIIEKENPIITQHTSVFWLKSNINTALLKDSETVELFKSILDREFNENIFYLLASVDPNSITKELAEKAIEKSDKNHDEFKFKLQRFYFVTPLYFGLALYYQKLNKLKSEEYYHLGNKEIFNSTRYNSYNYQNKILESIDHFEKSFKNFKQNNKNLGENNFFIVGSPRSGTTLVESIATSNNEVFAGGELATSKNLIGNYLRLKETNGQKMMNDFNTKYLRRTKYMKKDFKYVIDKLPENFLYLGYILNFLPKTKIIRLFRNPWDTAISLYKQRYVQNIPYSSSFFNIGVFMANFEAINLYWNSVIHNKDECILDIYYEEIVKDDTTAQKKIYEFLGIKASYNKEKRDQFFSSTASIRQVQGGIHQKSIKKQEFVDKKDEFYQSFEMQRKYWKIKGIVPENSSFFGYEVN